MPEQELISFFEVARNKIERWRKDYSESKSTQRYFMPDVGRICPFNRASRPFQYQVF
jgi:hypothetical protein